MLFKILRLAWHVSPGVMKEIIRRKISTVNSLINENTITSSREISSDSNIDIVSEYRDLIKSLVLNFNEIHIRLQMVEQSQKASIKNE